MKKILILLVTFFINQSNKASQKELFSESEFLTYCMARKVADIVFTVLKNEEGVSFPDRRNDCVNPLYDRTNGGLLLEFVGDAPNAIHTPWGRWCIHSGVSLFSHDAVKNNVNIKVLQEQHKKKLLKLLPLHEMSTFYEFNLFGPLYHIQVEGLPEAERVKVQSQVIDEEHGSISTPHCAEIIQKWQAMTLKWSQEIKPLSLV